MKLDGILGAVPVLLLCACGGSTTAPHEPPHTKIPVYTVSLAPATVAIGGSVPRTAKVRNDAGAEVSASVSWTSDDPAVATVSAAGVVTGVAAGTTTLRAGANGAVGTASITVSDLAFSALYLGSRSACARTASGTLYCWGNNGPGAIGSLMDDEVCYVDLFCSSTPRVGVAAPTLAQVTMAATHSCGLLPTGAAYCWGRNDESNLGAVSSETCQVKTEPVACSHTPLAVEGGHSFTALGVGSEAIQTCGLDGAGTAWCWGHTAAGITRTPVAVPGGLAFASVVTGVGHACGLTAAGAAYCWGSDELGPIGTGGAAGASPQPVTGGLVFVTLTAAYDHTCGLTSAGVAYCWGANAGGQLGDGTRTTRPAPTAVSGGKTFASISAGHDHTCGLTTAGLAYCWGANIDAGLNLGGWLGDGTTVSSAVPVAVARGLVFAEVLAARSFTCGRTTTARIYCWGSNRFGNLGIGSWGDFATRPVGLGGLP